MNILKKLPSVLLPWYSANRRDLPWRKDRDCYAIWISEVMLQQTRVEAVKGYYVRFLEKLPTVSALANCDDDTLHKLWEGLGYYSRVRNLKKAAQVIVNEYNGQFPSAYEDVLSLPGIGAYTAGAICSIAYNMPTPAVDGNVLRVVSRLTADATPIHLPAYKKAVQGALEQVYPKNAGDFTQALMELGATICGPNRKPNCGACPCKAFCKAYQQGIAQQLPVKRPKKEKKVEEKTVFVLSCDGHYALEKRPDNGLLASLWQFPNAMGKLDIPQALQWVESQGLKPRQLLRQVHRNHIFTHICWEMDGIYLEVSQCAGTFAWLTAEEIRQNAALPTAFRQFWEEIDHV